MNNPEKIKKVSKEFSLAVYNCEGAEVDTLKLNKDVFDGSLNEECLYQAVNGFRANQRMGLASTKTRGEVSGGGKKPWKQKGTGRARVGSTRSPLWKHGGVVFGPHPRDFSYNLPAKIKNVALRTALNSKLNENNLILLDKLELKEAKTKMAVKVFSSLKVFNAKLKKNPKVLFLTDKLEKDQKTALKNLNLVSVNLAKDTHAYEVVNSNKVVITKQALNDLTERLLK
ncbi:MAG: 50S ribosomal protein L4 [Candidatus Omnitrophica bacterium]|jgi:large subunit ribosomal protein L4|nr:50S ribosomal protein L4 [Candidatus Omnitrophota bacterium]